MEVEYSQFRRPSNFNGGSILDLPKSMRFLAKGFYPTTDPRFYRPVPRLAAGIPAKPPTDKVVQGKQSKGILTALHRMLQGQAEKNVPYEEKGIARPQR